MLSIDLLAPFSPKVPCVVEVLGPHGSTLHSRATRSTPQRSFNGSGYVGEIQVSYLKSPLRLGTNIVVTFENVAFKRTGPHESARSSRYSGSSDSLNQVLGFHILSSLRYS